MVLASCVLSGCGPSTAPQSPPAAAAAAAPAAPTSSSQSSGAAAPVSIAEAAPVPVDAGSGQPAVKADEPLAKILQDSVGARVSAPDPKTKHDKTVEILLHVNGAEQLFAAIGLEQVPSGEPQHGLPCASIDFVDGLGRPFANALVFCEKGALVPRATFVVKGGTPSAIRIGDPKALQKLCEKNDLKLQ